MQASGRPSLKQGPKVTREQLILIAANMISKKGVASTSMRSIAAEANVSLSTLQHHFSTKQDLLFTIIDELIIPFETKRSSQGKTIEEYFKWVIQARLDNFIETPGLTGRVLTGHEGEEEILLDYLSSCIEGTIKNDFKRIENAKDENQLRAINTKALMTLVGIAMTTLSSSNKALSLLFGIDLKKRRDRNKLARGITDIILYGILPRNNENKKRVYDN